MPGQQSQLARLRIETGAQILDGLGVEKDLGVLTVLSLD